MSDRAYWEKLLLVKTNTTAMSWQIDANL